jgi:uncharacterized protein YndB with AHSA1/START domain
VISKSQLCNNKPIIMTTQFKTLIDAPREKVWDILWADDTYQKWTAAFCEGSKAITTGMKSARFCLQTDKTAA